MGDMGPTEYVWLALVILLPLVLAVAVTLWSLEQVIPRRKRRSRPPESRPPGEPGPPGPSVDE